eukprot:363725-Chlamydomonas_euryale.AAC.9
MQPRSPSIAGWSTCAVECADADAWVSPIRSMRISVQERICACARARMMMHPCPLSHTHADSHAYTAAGSWQRPACLGIKQAPKADAPPPKQVLNSPHPPQHFCAAYPTLLASHFPSLASNVCANLLCTHPTPYTCMHFPPSTFLWVSNLSRTLCSGRQFSR